MNSIADTVLQLIAETLAAIVKVLALIATHFAH